MLKHDLGTKGLGIAGASSRLIAPGCESGYKINPIEKEQLGTPKRHLLVV
jgi:hypothetical protein